MYLLDTNVVSELRKVRAGKAHPGVAEWATSTPAAQLFLSAITLHELEHGVLLAERSDPRKGALLRIWLDTSVARPSPTGCYPSTRRLPVGRLGCTRPTQHRFATP